MMNRKSKKRRLYLCCLAAAVLAVVFTTPVLAQEDPNDPVLPDPNMPEGPRLPGTVEGTGTYFEVTDSNYINITFESTEPVNLRLESVPEMVVMDINTADGAASTQITLTGFPPSTTYYKYEDNYHNGVAFTTDDNGTYTFAQDLTQPHLVFIQSNPGTKFIRDDATGGDATSIGTWDWATKTCTLTQNVYETIQIDSYGITLDGAGHTVTGTGYSGFGVYFYGRTGVTIKNINVQGFYSGIYLPHSSYNTLTTNTVSNNRYGIFLGEYSSYNTLINNTANSNNYSGIFLLYSNNNTLTNNTALNNHDGIHIGRSSNNALAGNTVSNNWDEGITLDGSGNTTLTNNTVFSNKFYGIFLADSGGSTLSGNTMSGSRYNFRVRGRSDFHFDNDIDTTNTVNGKPIYYVKGAVGEVYDSSTAGDAGTLYLINCDNITIRDLTLTNNYYGVFLWKTQNSTIENVLSSDNSSGYGIYLQSSINNTLTGNTVSNSRYGIQLGDYSMYNSLTGNTVSNNREGIYLYRSTYNTLTGNTFSNNWVYYGVQLRYSSNNTLTANTFSNNRCGISLYYSSNNQIYNNNFIDNTEQATVYGASSSNVFNLDKPIGGNYWSNWTSPDGDGDGFVDNPYFFEGGQDNLPWTRPYGITLNVPSATYPTIQSAIDAARGGDTVIVLDGTYTGTGNRDIDFKSKAITVGSQNGPENCIIDCQNFGRGFCFHSGENENSVLDGFTITNGDVSDRESLDRNGGAIYCCSESSPIIRNNIITGNTAASGGGIYSWQGSPTITNNIITGNGASWGGGIYCWNSPTITNNTITENTAVYDGGGIYCYEWGTIANNTITKNTAQRRGGGIWAWEDGAPTIINNIISENWAEQEGGGIGLLWTNLTIIIGNVIVGNGTAGSGGGICMRAPVLMTNNTIAGNTAVSGGGMFNQYSNPTVSNCIFWDNSPSEIDGSALVTYTDIKGGWPGEGNINTNPLFVDAANSDYRLQSNSACIDVGNNTAVPPEVVTDLYGNPRITNVTVDMVAYEFKNSPPVANAGGPYVEQATSWNGAYVDLDGTVSSDPDGDPLAYEWDLDLSWDSDGDGDPTNDVDETGPTSTWSFPIGQTEISLVVTDDQDLKSEPDVTSVTVSVIDVSIDIKPGSFPNSINMGSNGVVPVAFLTDPDFDASTIDPATVTLRGEDFTDGLVKLRGKKDVPVPMSNLEDIDGDGDLDLIVHLVTEKLAEYELEAMCELGALTYNGYVVSGSDVIHVVPE